MALFFYGMMTALFIVIIILYAIAISVEKEFRERENQIIKNRQRME